jgi:hypothetical protein
MCGDTKLQPYATAKAERIVRYHTFVVIDTYMRINIKQYLDIYVYT